MPVGSRVPLQPVISRRRHDAQIAEVVRVTEHAAAWRVRRQDCRPVHQIRYEPRKHSDAEILLFFDAETFHHVKTTYSIANGNLPGATITESVNVRADRSQLEERFSDFKTVDGLTLPTHWNLQFTRELPNGSTTLSEWGLKEDQITNNVGLDPKNFELK